MKLIAYNAEVFLKSGGKVAVLLSLTTIQDAVNNHRNTGSFYAVDLSAKEIVSVYKDSIEFVKFTPIYSKEEESLGEPSENPDRDNGTVSQE